MRLVNFGGVLLVVLLFLPWEAEARQISKAQRRELLRESGGLYEGAFVGIAGNKYRAELRLPRKARGSGYLKLFDWQPSENLTIRLRLRKSEIGGPSPAGKRRFLRTGFWIWENDTRDRRALFFETRRAKGPGERHKIIVVGMAVPGFYRPTIAARYANAYFFKNDPEKVRKIQQKFGVLPDPVAVP